jgi:hypothetical protein
MPWTTRIVLAARLRDAAFTRKDLRTVVRGLAWLTRRAARRFVLSVWGIPLPDAPGVREY